MKYYSNVMDIWIVSKSNGTLEFQEEYHQQKPLKDNEFQNFSNYFSQVPRVFQKPQ